MPSATHPHRQRNYALDVLKLLCAFLVISLHTPILEVEWQDVTRAFARVAVPIFFMITGYYWSSPSRDKAIGKLKYIAKITAVAAIAYLAWGVVNEYRVGELNQHLSHVFSLGTWFGYRLWVFNDTQFISSHLWYMPAVMYATIIFMLANDHLRHLYWLIIPLFVACYALSFSSFDDTYTYRNWLFMALPFMLTGHFIRNHDFSKLTTRAILGAVVVLAVIQFVEVVLYLRWDMYPRRDFFATTPLLAVAIFLLAVRNPQFGANSLTARLGCEYTAWIYLYHKLWLFVINYVENRLPGVNLWTAVLCFVLTIASIWLVKKIWSSLRPTKQE